MVSVGCDLEQAARFTRLLKNDRFLQGVYTTGEREHISASANPERTAAGIWCAKEACAKALGRGLFGLLPRDLEVTWDTLGAPQMIFHESAAAQFPGLHLSVSISHAGMYVMAAVTVETP